MDAWIQPDAGSTVAFVGICGAVVAMILLGVRRVEPAWSVRAAGFAALFVAATGGAILLLPSLPVVAVFGFFGACNLIAVGLGLSPVGRRLSTLPMVWLVGFHAFRLPLEVLLHRWFVGGTLPVQMTWEGQNLDVVTGALALGVAAWGWRSEVPRAAAWVVEIVGSLLLLNVMRVAVLSAPTPLRAFEADPPVLLAWHLPFGWIVPLCVSAALLGHIVLARRLLSG